MPTERKLRLSPAVAPAAGPASRHHTETQDGTERSPLGSKPSALFGMKTPEPGVAVAHAPLPYQHEEWRPAGEHFKKIPETKVEREKLRLLAADTVRDWPRRHAPQKQDLFETARKMLEPLGYGLEFTGFAMVLLNNEYWRDEFAAVPFEKRLFSMPHCLKQAEKCTAKLDEVQLHCNGCGLCSLADFSQIGKRMGYNVLIAEGTPVVLKLVASGEVEGILGVACLNVLEKAFDKVLQVGLPSIAIPLLRDTCHNTEVDQDWVLAAMGYQKTGEKRTRSFAPLLRDMAHEFDPKPLEALAPLDRGQLPRGDPLAENERISMAWLRKGGKRFRPFLTAAAWQAFTDQDEVPVPVKRVAAAMEFVHKASLIHDDIEDDDDFRYGTETLHKTHTVPVALNIGDYLLGRGYRVIHEESAKLGFEQTAKIMGKLAEAHVKLAEGQGAELLWRKNAGKDAGPGLKPLECLRIYALKTAPAFDAALYAGAVLAGRDAECAEALSEFSKHLGVAYQIQNDLKDMDEHAGNKVVAGGDILKGRPTVLFALALESANDDERTELLNAARRALDGSATQEAPAQSTARLARLRELYYKYEIPLQAAMLADRQRAKALEAVQNVKHEGLRALFSFLTATLLE